MRVENTGVKNNQLSVECAIITTKILQLNETFNVKRNEFRDFISGKLIERMMKMLEKYVDPH
jgi:hypothetical protein